MQTQTIDVRGVYMYCFIDFDGFHKDWILTKVDGFDLRDECLQCRGSEGNCMEPKSRSLHLL